MDYNNFVSSDCPPPPQTIGFIDNCTNEGITDMLICNPTCPEGTVMVPDLSSLEYRCGAETNFEWIPFDIFPVCEGKSTSSLWRIIYQALFLN